MHNKKILIYGENWEGTLPQLLSTDLQRRGYQITNFDFTDILPGIKKQLFHEKVLRRCFYTLYVTKIRNALIHKVKETKPDIVIIAKGLHLSPQTVQTIKENCQYLVNWNPDDFFNPKNSNNDLISSIKHYDLIVSARPHLKELYLKNGMKGFLYLDWYYIPSLHKDYQLPPSNLTTFIGSWSPYREEYLNQVDTPISIWGAGWSKSSHQFRKKNNVNFKILSQIEMSQLFNSSKFNINFLTHENSDRTNLRIFEVTASAGVLLTESNNEIDRYLTPGKDYLSFSNPSELNAIISSKIDTSEICLSGYKRITKEQNTFNDRATTLVEYIENNLS